MWNYEKRLQYPVKITHTNPKIAQVIITQFGGPDGELAASMRYLSQRYSIPNVTATVSNGDNNNSLEANIFAQVGRVSKTGCVLKVCCWNEQLSGSKFNVSWIAVGKREL